MSSFLLGLGIGLTVGVLFAPKSGAETRKYIADKTSESGEFLAHQGEHIRDAATDLVNRGRKVVADQSEKLAGVLHTAARRIQVPN